MSEILKTIQQRQSTRIPYNPNKHIPHQHLQMILEAARWTPTPHNMQNYQIIVIDDKSTLNQIGKIKTSISAEFLKENYQQLSFSTEELQKKKVGILASGFPPDWVNPAKIAQVAKETAPTPLAQFIGGSPTLLLVLYDFQKRPPASEGDVLGFVGLGCLMENIWLMAEALGVSMQILSTFANPPVEKEIKQLLNVPANLKIAFAIRLGYTMGAFDYPRIRRDIAAFTHHNMYGNKGI